MQTNGTDNAFPMGNDHGMSKFEYFAAAAMQGILSSEVYSQAMPSTVAKQAVARAKALITELNKTEHYADK